MTSQFHLHLVSDSTGETVSSVARAALVQFEGVEPIEHHWALVRGTSQMDKVLDGISKEPGVVMFTLVNPELRDRLVAHCVELKIPCIPVLSRVIRELTAYLGMETSGLPGKQHALDEEYFSRVDAINFAITHDDGQATWNLEEADIVLVGASRTSKSPTCVYLAYRGFKAANVPYVPDCPLPPGLAELKYPLVVGLTIQPDALIQIRKNRLLSLKEERNTTYVDEDAVRREIADARRLFTQMRWPIIDVTRRSVEETAAQIIQLAEGR